MSTALPISVSTRRMAPVTATAGMRQLPFTFPVLRETDVRLLRTRAGATVELTYGTDFTVWGVNEPEGGTVTLATGALAGDVYVVEGDADLDRLASVASNGRFSSAQIDRDFDLALIRDQELRRDIEDLGQLDVSQAVATATGAAAQAAASATSAANSATTASTAGATRFQTLTAFQAATVPGTVQSVETMGYASAGDGGGALYRRVGSQPIHWAKAQSADGAWWQMVVADRGINVKSLGAKGDGTTEDSTPIQRAITSISSYGGGEVFLPAGSYRISSPLVINASDIRLVGAGRGDFHYTPPFILAPTRLVWAGAPTATMVTFSPGGAQWLSGCVFDGIYLDAGSGCDRAISVFSSFGGRFIVSGRDFTTCLLLMGCASGLAENADSMQNYVEIRGSCTGTACMVQLTGISNANTCFNRFGFIDGNYENGSAIQLYNCDNNIFEHIRLYRQPGGTGTGISLAAGLANEQARGNIFIDCSPGAGGVRAQGTESGAAASKQNYIVHYDTPNDAPLPTYGAGATLWYGTLDDTFPCAAAITSTGSYSATGATDVVWNGERFDVSNSFASNRFTAPKPGNYRVRWQITHQTGVTVGDKWVIYIVSPSESVGTIYNVRAAVEATVSGEAVVNLLAGQTVYLTIQRAEGAGNFPVLADGRFNRFEVTHLARSL